MEKSGRVNMTSTELSEIQSGVLPSRLASEWGFSLDELLKIVREGSYEIINDSLST